MISEGLVLRGSLCRFFRRKKATFSLLCALFLSVVLFSLQPGIANETEALSGGETTVFQSGQNAFSMPLANLSRENRRLHAVGNSFFNKPWVAAPASTTARDGLGPLFNTASCSACHVRDGRGRPDPEGLMVFKIRSGSDGGPHPVFGNQLSMNAIAGAAPEGRVTVTYETQQGYFDDQTLFALRKPKVSVALDSQYEGGDSPLIVSPRIALPVFGVGLLEAVPETALFALADPEDEDGDGISGRIRVVKSGDFQTVGRFGWKADQPSVRLQTAAAFRDDMGITSSLFSEENHSSAQSERWKELPEDPSPDVSDRTLERVVVYLQSLAPPAARNTENPDFAKGKAIFHSVGCADCHLPELKTGEEALLPELAGQIIRPYTDLLLHDMGKGLADPAGSGPDRAEWRTPPLWGIGLNQAVNGNAFYLHDGRALSIEEAILWHGGEGDRSREKYKALSKAERSRLLGFLNSL